MTSTFVVPDLPGTAITFVGETVVTVPPSDAAVVALPVVLDWGPANAPTLCTDYADFLSKFGSGATPGQRAVLSCFSGSGLPGQGGAGGVIVYRLAGTGKAKASHTVQNTTPATALTLTAKYEGDNGELIGFTVGDDPRDAAKDILKIYYGGVRVEQYEYPNTDIANLAAQINATSKWVTAVEAITGVALAVVSTVTNLTGGDNGATLTGTDWTDATDALEFADFTIFAYNGTDSTIRAALVSWIQSLADDFRPVMLVLGGASAETVSDAVARSTGIDAATKHRVVNVGVGTYHDDLLGVDVSTAELAPRLAGVLAARGERQSLTFADVAGLHSVASDPGPSTDELLTLKEGGVTALRRVSSPNTELRVSEGVTAFTATNETARPYEVFSEPRMVRVMDLYVRRMRLYSDENIIGDTTVTDDTRAAVRTQGRQEIDRLLRDGLILGDPAPFIRTPVLSDPDLASSIPYEFGWRFARTTKNVIGHGQVG